MTYRTLREHVWERPLASITVPAGTRVKPCGDGTGQFWVDEFGWMQGGEAFYRHDAVHYGIRINADNVGEAS